MTNAKKKPRTMSVEEYRAMQGLPAKQKRQTAPDQYDSTWERHYADYLECEKRAGRVIAWAHHPFTVIAVPAVKDAEGKTIQRAITYTPDFLVTREGEPDPIIIEVKGHFREKDRIRTKAAIAKLGFAFQFVLAEMKGKSWEHKAMN